jgi:hypothetical protein
MKATGSAGGLRRCGAAPDRGLLHAPSGAAIVGGMIDDLIKIAVSVLFFAALVYVVIQSRSRR